MIAVVQEKRQIKAGVRQQAKPLSHRKESAMEIDMHPLNLHKANLELMLRILNLSQDFRHRGLEGNHPVGTACPISALGCKTRA